MKIIKVNYMEGEARFVIEGRPNDTYCIKLKDQTTTKEVTDKLKTMVPEDDIAEQLYNNLNLKDLEGTEI